MLYIFGAGQVAEVSNYYFSKSGHFPDRRFVVDEDYMLQTKIDGIDVITFENALANARTDNDLWFTAISYRDRNRKRSGKYKELKALGFNFASYVHPTAQLWDGFVLPENSMILENNVLQYKCRLGSNSILWSNNHVGHHTFIGNNSFLSSGVIISGNCEVGDNCFFGVNSTIFDGITIGSMAIIAAGAVVNRNVIDNEVFR